MALEDFVYDFVTRILRVLYILVFELVMADAPYNTNVCPQLSVETSAFQANKAC
jgi:hypothetical protein